LAERVAAWFAARRQLDQHPPRKWKDRHISVPSAIFGGGAVPMISFILVWGLSIAASDSCWFKFMMKAPRPVGGGWVPAWVGVVNPDTDEASLMELPELCDAEPAETRPGTESDGVDSGRLGLAN